MTLDYRSDLNDNNVSDLLKKSFQKDMILQFTSCGIHKDDLIFKIDNNSIKKFGSQGQELCPNNWRGTRYCREWINGKQV